jgi:hypothetical protein
MQTDHHYLRWRRGKASGLLSGLRNPGFLIGLVSIAGTGSKPNFSMLGIAPGCSSRLEDGSMVAGG